MSLWTHRDQPVGILRALEAPWDLAGLAVLRVLFGLMMAFGLTRFVVKGWVERVLIEPTFFFKYPGFEWVSVASPAVLYSIFALTAVAALAVALGCFYRFAIVAFAVGFGYLQLLDVSLYLNHYYLVLVLTGIFICLPLNGQLSIDAWLRPALRRATFPAWATLLLRVQLSVVYLFAALAKAHPDWLFYGQPLTLWMRARTELPLIGSLLDNPGIGLAMSWAGFLYDLTIWIFLWWRRTRGLAYGAVVVFHGLTWAFFEIGMFPIIMIVSTTVFFDPSWPRRLLGRRDRLAVPSYPRPGRTGPHPLTLAALSLFVIAQVSLPLRHFFFLGDVLWNERGMRFGWKVMVREKNGSVTYLVTAGTPPRQREVSAMDYLTWRQFSDISGQPDLILQLGRHIAWDLERRGFGPIHAISVDAQVSLNGRPPQPLVDPNVDLRTVLDSHRYGRWLLPGPKTPPPASTPLLP